MISILPLLQTPIVFYTIILTIIWIFVQIISRINSRSFALNINTRLTFAILIVYAFLAVFSIYTNVNYFPYPHAVMLAFTLTMISCSPKCNSEPLFIIALAVALMPVLVMISTRHPFPLGDDARFIGFAKAIDSDGRWIPFKYAENPYYQFFHLIPYLEYVLAIIPEFGLENITAYYLTLKLCSYFLYLSFIYLIVKKLTCDESISLTAMLLLSITPPLALAQMVHQACAIVLFLPTAFLLLRGLETKQPVASVLATFPLMATGVVAHATYTIMVMAFIIPFIIAREEWVKNSLNHVARFLTLLVSISLTYWISIYILDLIVRPTVNAVERLIDLLSGRTPHFPFQGTVKPWYTPESSIFFISWALVPSIVASYILLSLVSKTRRNIRFWNGIEILGLAGLGGTVLNYILRTLPTFGGRYFYWLYILMLPLSALVIRKTSKKLLSLVLSLVIISLVSFYGVQDFTLSGNTYGERIWWADLNSWTAAKHISPFLESSYTIKWIEGRISAPLSALRKPVSITPEEKCQGIFVIIGMDDLGLYSILKSPHFPAKQLNVNTESVPGLNVVLNFYKFRGIWIAKP